MRPSGGNRGDYGSSSAGILKREQERNEIAGIRCVGLTIETKPDWGLLDHGNQMLKLGCTRVELGIAVGFRTSSEAYKQRAFAQQTQSVSIRILKDLGLKINAHYMLGLPGVETQQGAGRPEKAVQRSWISSQTC